MCDRQSYPLLVQVWRAGGKGGPAEGMIGFSHYRCARGSLLLTLVFLLHIFLPDPSIALYFPSLYPTTSTLSPEPPELSLPSGSSHLRKTRPDLTPPLFLLRKCPSFLHSTLLSLPLAAFAFCPS